MEADPVILASARRAKGISWLRISELFGTSAQAAQPRYGAVIGAG